MDTSQFIVCPFCGFKDTSDYQILLHIEIHHSEDGNSPFAVEDSNAPSSSNLAAGTLPSAQHVNATTPPPSSTHESNYIDCPFTCGERLPAAEVQSHVDFHLAEDMTLEEESGAIPAELSIAPSNNDQAYTILSDTFSTSIPASIRNYGQTTSKSGSGAERQRMPSLRELFFGSPNKKRLASTHSGTSKSGKIKRLGVGKLCSIRVALLTSSDCRTGSICSREAHAFLASTDARRRRQGYNF